MLTALTTVFHSPAFNHAGASFDTHVKSAGVADAIRARHPGIEIASPRAALKSELRAVHDDAYVDALMTGEPVERAESNGFSWSPDLLAGVLASTGGVRDAALHALSGHCVSGSLSSGLHHAGPGYGRGYCTVNGLPIAALAARAAGAHRILILDLDAHCGGGTAAIIQGHSGIEQLDVSVIAYDCYDTDSQSRLVMASGVDYLATVRSELNGVRAPEDIDLVVYNAGMDPHESAGGVVGVSSDVIREREHLVFSWASQHDIPVAFVLAGGYARSGYALDEVVNLHMETIAAASAVGSQARSGPR